MLLSIIAWFKKYFERQRRKREFNKKLKELRKKDPFIYKH